MALADAGLLGDQAPVCATITPYQTLKVAEKTSVSTGLVVQSEEIRGRSCLCNTGPKCRHEHRLKQDPRFTVTQPTPGTFRWTAPSGRTYDTEPTRYPI